VFGRLALGVSDEQAEAELSILYSRYSTQGAKIAMSLVGPAALPLMRGLAIGSAGAGCLAAFMRRAGLPAGINPLDPLAYVAVAGLLAVTAAVASYAPTRRALRIEPIKALRVD
jgi:ABC-type antimicrobial peptide transport system permease subunit